MAVGTEAEVLGARAFLAELGADTANNDLVAGVISWFRQESGSLANVIGNNPFNIRPGIVSYLASSTRTSTRGNGQFLVFPDLATGFKAAAALLKRLAPSYGYGEVIRMALAGNVVGFLAALALSSWDAAHYGVTTDASALTLANHLLRVFASLTGIQLPAAGTTLATLAGKGKVPVASLPALQGPFASASTLLPWVNTDAPHGVAAFQQHYSDAKLTAEFYQSKHPARGAT